MTEVQMTNLARALIAILALCEVMGCRRSTNRSVPRDLEAKREEYEAIVAHDPDNYRANSSLSSVYTVYYSLYRDVTPDPAKAQQFRDKALIATQKAIQKAPRLDGKVILATNLERLGDEKDALSIYKAFLAEAERSPNSTNGDFEATPMMQKEIRHQREVLIMDIQLRVKELEGQSNTSHTQ